MKNWNSKTTRLFAAIVLGLSGSIAAADMATPLQLSGKNEVPPVTTEAMGSSMIVVASDGSVSGDITTTGMTGTMAHIHMGASDSNGPPIVTLTKGDNGQWMVPADTKLNAEQLKAYQAGGLYVNVHDAAHPNGAVRAQLNK